MCEAEGYGMIALVISVKARRLSDVLCKNQRNGQRNLRCNDKLNHQYFLLNEKKLDEPILLFYVNENAIIIGKKQNTIEEINQDGVDKLGVQVVRRFSVGGAVYHDMGNICFCFITEDDGDSFRDFGKFTEPVIEALHKMGATGQSYKAVTTFSSTVRNSLEMRCIQTMAV